MRDGWNYGVLSFSSLSLYTGRKLPLGTLPPLPANTQLKLNQETFRVKRRL
jgi:hypothetical protein